MTPQVSALWGAEVFGKGAAAGVTATVSTMWSSSDSTTEASTDYEATSGVLMVNMQPEVKKCLAIHTLFSTVKATGEGPGSRDCRRGSRRW
jgi:hypothetical protein